MNANRVILVNSGNYAFEGAIPLGLMAVATTLQWRDHLACQILDLPFEQPQNLERQLVHFWDSVDLSNVLFVGFSSMCNTLPRSLSLARILRTVSPDLPIVFGGPEASAIATELVNAYHYIDVIVVGEAESVLSNLIESLRTGIRRNQPGLWFQNPSEQGFPVSNKNAKSEMSPLVDLDTLEPIDYQTYPRAFDGKYFVIEIGRGCPYACSFCSTKDFFRRRFRMKSPERIVSEITAVVRDREFDHFDFVHDMFTVNRKLVVAICEAIIQSAVRIRWSCSARTDRVDEELLKLMLRAGCTDIFFGLEAGSPRIQQAIHKNLNLDDAVWKLQTASMLGIGVTAALILGFPQETEQDLIDTVNLVIRLRSLRPNLKAVQVHLLSPLAGTELTNTYFSEILYDGHSTGVTSVNCLTEWEESEIRKHPDIFSSFYYFRNPAILRSTYKWLYRALSSGNSGGSDLNAFYELHKQQSGKHLVNWAKSMGLYPVQGTYISRWTALRQRNCFYRSPCSGSPWSSGG